MLKEACAEELMSPLLKEMFNRNTRIIWLGNDGICEFSLKTTWENICESYLQLSLEKYT